MKRLIRSSASSALLASISSVRSARVIVIRSFGSLRRLCSQVATVLASTVAIPPDPSATETTSNAPPSCPGSGLLRTCRTRPCRRRSSRSHSDSPMRSSMVFDDCSLSSTFTFTQPPPVPLPHGHRPAEVPPYGHPRGKTTSSGDTRGSHSVPLSTRSRIASASRRMMIRPSPPL